MKRTTTLAVGSLILAGLVFFSSRGQVWAQEAHGHESPHGGEVRTMGDNHVEFLVVEENDDKGFIVVYLLDKNQKPVPVDGVDAVVYLTLPDKSKQTLKPVVTTEMLKSDHDEEEEHEKKEMHNEGKEEEGKEHGMAEKDVSHFQAPVDLKGIDTFDAVVSLKKGKMRKNLRFKYVRSEHGHEQGEEHKEAKK
jgi:hypothetical protein